MCILGASRKTKVMLIINQRKAQMYYYFTTPICHLCMNYTGSEFTDYRLYLRQWVWEHIETLHPVTSGRWPLDSQYF